MSVQSNSPVTSSNVNSAFMSRTVDTSTVGVVSLENTGSSTVSNVQQLLNHLKWTVSTVQNVSASGTLTYSTTDLNQVLTVAGSGGAVSASNTPFGSSAPTNATTVRLIGTNDTNTVGFQYADVDYGILLNGDVSLGRGDVLELMWNTELNRWIEISRNF
tara:strand:- start:185 stop:664 length:480 start_codon:yes stop_codon:yes gene_type:complete